MHGEKAVEMFQLVKANHLLPAKLEELIPLSFIGTAAVQFYKARIKMMGQLKVAEEQSKQTIKDGQDIGEMLLDIEARIGELLPTPSLKTALFKKKGSLTQTRSTLPEGITSQRASRARAIAKHPDVVARIKAQAREMDDIPTRTAVLNQIQADVDKKRTQETKGKMEKLKGIIALEQAKYLLALDECLRALPSKPPKSWNEEAFKEAKVKANILIRRLEVFHVSN